MDEYSSAPPTRNVTCAQLRTWISTDLNNTRFRYGIQIDFSPIFFFLFLAQQAEKKVKRRSNQRQQSIEWWNVQLEQLCYAYNNFKFESKRKIGAKFESGRRDLYIFVTFSFSEREQGN